MEHERGHDAAVQVLAKAYGGENIAVTGGASFIGSHLTEILVEAGGDVTVADDLSSGSVENLKAVADDVRVLEGDLRDPLFARKALEDQQVVFHLAAAHGGRGYIDSHPVECMNNVVLDHTVLAASTNARRVVIASSACAYPTNLQSEGAQLLLREEDANFDVPGAAFADGEYGWAKLMGELQVRAFHRQYGIDGIVCRLFTAYGPRENESHAVIALIAKALARLDPYPIWGDGTQTRNFTFVADTAFGMALAGAKLSGFDVVNVGSQVHTSIDELIEKIFDIVGWRPSTIDRQIDRPVGVNNRAADIRKSEQLLGWSPHTSVDEGLRETIPWCEAVLGPERLARLNDALMSR